MRAKSLFVAPVLWAVRFAVLFSPAAFGDWSFAILGDTRGNNVHNLSVSSALDDFGHTGYQVTSGNGGAPSDAAFINHDPGVDVHYANGTNFGFALATVTDRAMTINYHLYNAANDTWSVAGYQTILGVPEPSTVALVAAGLMILAAPGKRARMRSAADS